MALELFERFRLKNGFLSEIHAKYVPYSNVEKPSLLKRPNNLRLEGSLLTLTEKSDKFTDFLFNERPHLHLPTTTLKPEGAMQSRTETRDKFAPPGPQERPPLCKKNTNLHLEGSLDIASNYWDKYPKHEPQKRPPLTKHGTNLHMSGELQLDPEYKSAYVEFKQPQELRRKPALPKNNLVVDADGFFPHTNGDSASANKTFFSESRHEIPFLRDSAVPKANLRLEGKIEMSPEYRNAYVDHSEGGRKSPHRRRLVSHPPNLRVEGRLEGSPEYRSAYVDFPRERPSLRRAPQCHLVNDGEVSTNYLRMGAVSGFPG